MEPVTAGQIAAALKHLESLDLTGRVGLTEEIRANQPEVLLTLIELTHEGVKTKELDHAVHLLRVIYTIFTVANGGTLPLVTPENIAKAKLDLDALYLALQRGTLTPEVYLDYHPEPHLLIWVCNSLTENTAKELNNNNDLILKTLQVVMDAFVAVIRNPEAGARPASARPAAPNPALALAS